MPVWYEGECLPNILCGDENVLDVVESDVSKMWLKQMMNMKIMRQPQMRVKVDSDLDYLSF